MGRILFVDAEPEIRILTRTMLEKVGYEVVVAKDIGHYDAGGIRPTGGLHIKPPGNLDE